MATSERDPFKRKYNSFKDVFADDSHSNNSGVTFDSRSTDALNEDIKEAKTYIESLVQDTEKKLSKIVDDNEEEFKKIRDENKTQFKAVKKDIENSKIRIVETLALFVALFTFLSLQVQAFKDQSDPRRVLSIILVSAGLITFFVLILDMMIKTKQESQGILKTRFYLLFGMSVWLIIAGLALLIK